MKQKLEVCRKLGRRADTLMPQIDIRGYQAPRNLLRRSELVYVVYFLYVAGAAVLLPVSPQVTRLVLAVNFGVVAGYLMIGYWERRRPSLAVSMARDWLPLALVLLAYKQMGWFAPEHHTYELEQGWVIWDRLLLNHMALGATIEFFGSLLPSLLELSYALVYSVGPLSVAILYFYGKRKRVDAFLFTFVLGTLMSYALYPYFPSEPPRAVFPNADMPQVDTVFRQFNLWILSGGGIHTSVFPSGHVSHVFAAAFAMMMALPERKWPGRCLLVLAILIFVATVYGRYHYAVDGIAGIAVALVAVGITKLLGLGLSPAVSVRRAETDAVPAGEGRSVDSAG